MWESATAFPEKLVRMTFPTSKPFPSCLSHLFLVLHQNLRITAGEGLPGSQLLESCFLKLLPSPNSFLLMGCTMDLQLGLAVSISS